MGYLIWVPFVIFCMFYLLPVKVIVPTYRSFFPPEEPVEVEDEFRKQIIGKWRFRGEPLTIYRKYGAYFLEDIYGKEKVQRWPTVFKTKSDWMAFAIIDRIGKPDNIYSVNKKNGSLYYHTGCEAIPSCARVLRLPRYLDKEWEEL